MTSAQTVKRPRGRMEKAALISAVVGVAMLIIGMAGIAASAIIGASTRPGPLLEERAVTTEGAAARIVDTPTRQLENTIRIRVWHDDDGRIDRAIHDAVRQAGGHRMENDGRTRPAWRSSRSSSYAAPESMALWLAELDEQNGRNGYARLNDPPPPSETGGELTAVNVRVVRTWVGRRGVSNSLLGSGGLAALGVIVMVGGALLMAPPPTGRTH